MFKSLRNIGVAILLSYGLVFGANIVATSDTPRESTLLITTADERSNGSGVVIGDGLILTARHVAEVSQYTPLFVKIDGKLIPLHLVRKSSISDLALMGGDFKSPKVGVFTGDLSVGDSVLAVGFPFWSNLQSQVMTTGVVQGTFLDHTVTTTEAAPGNSGGGLFYRDWLGRTRLAGILVTLPGLPIGFFGFQLLTYLPSSESPLAIRAFLGER